METPYSVLDPDERPRRGRFWIGLAVGGLVAVAVMIAVGHFSRRALSMDVDSLPAPPPPVAVRTTATDTSQSSGIDVSRRNAIVRAVDRVALAVVTISVTQVQRERVTSPFADDPLWRFFFPDIGQEFERRVRSMGSGFIVSPDGLVLTNEHVIRGASEIVVSLPDGRTFNGKVSGEPDAQSDIAVVKISGSDLPVAPLGRSDDLMIGEWAIALGNPFGFLIRDSHPTVTVGVISALNRNFDVTSAGGGSYRDMIQTDASINPGNSGGPLVNSEGYVVGINTFIFTQGGGSEGIGFAIPIEKARQSMQDVLRFGQVRHNFWTGIHIQDVNRWIAESLGLPDDRGAIITEVEPNSPGAKGGLRRGDVILAVNGNAVTGDKDVRREFVGAVVGQRIEFTIVREGRRRQMTITLEEDPASRRTRE